MSDIHIKPFIIEHFLHVMYCNYIEIIMKQFRIEKKVEIINFISNKEEPQFWNNYELFTFRNKFFHLKKEEDSGFTPCSSNICLNSDIIRQINDDFMTIDIYETNYKYYDYLVEFALQAYCKDKERFRHELLTYVDDCVGLK
jgi:hypothetical protein